MGACKSRSAGASTDQRQVKVASGSTKSLAERIKGQMGIKVVLLGDQSTGKTSIILRLVRDEFVETAAPTIWFAAAATAVHSTHDARNSSCYHMWRVRSLQQRIVYGAEDHREQPAA